MSVLEELQAGRSVENERGEHTGIWNVERRLRLLYGETVSIRYALTIRITGGAVVEIILPTESRNGGNAMNYHMLIVDDEIHAIEGVKSDLDLNKLGITNLFTAFNIRQAKDIFIEGSIDILLCDIEMPQGSGLGSADLGQGASSEHGDDLLDKPCRF